MGSGFGSGDDLIDEVVVEILVRGRAGPLLQRYVQLVQLWDPFN